MTMMSDLSQDMLEAILSRVQRSSLRAVRLTCKQWNRFSKHRILCKPEARQGQVLGFTVMDGRLYSMRFNLHGLGLYEDEDDEEEEFVDAAIKPIGNILDVLELSQVCYCNGLLLCVTSNYLKELVVWNPYLEKFRSIQPRNGYRVDAKYALGYDKNKNYKILRFFDSINRFEDYYEIYDLKSNSWGFYDDVPNWDRYMYRLGASLNGNTYFMSGERKTFCKFIICFDFTRERFGEIIPLPFAFTWPYGGDSWTLSSVREEKLALLHQFREVEDYTLLMEIWLTDKIEPSAASWSKFLRVDMDPPIGFGYDFDRDKDCFFIDEEKEVAVVFSSCVAFSSSHESHETSSACVIRDNMYMETVDLYKVANSQQCVARRRQYRYATVMCSPSYYAPSLVRIDKITGRGRKKNKKRKHKSLF